MVGEEWAASGFIGIAIGLHRHGWEAAFRAGLGREVGENSVLATQYEQRRWHTPQLSLCLPPNRMANCLLSQVWAGWDLGYPGPKGA